MKTRIIDRINNLKKWKKLLILLLYIIVIVRIEYIYIGNEGEQNYRNFEGYVFSDYTLLDCNNIIQEFKSDKNTLNGLELLFDNISDDKIGAINLCIYSDKELIYQTQLSLMNINNQEWKYVYVNAPMYDDKEYVLFMSATEECTQVPKVFVVKENYAPEIISSYNDTKLIDGQIAVNYGYLVSSESELKEHFKLTLCWLIYFIIALVIICNIEIIVSKYKKIKKLLLNRVKEQIVVAIIEIITCIVYVMFSGINFQVSTIIILLVISILTTLHMDMKTSYVEKTVNTVGKKALLLASYAYSAFALVGQRIYVYPMNKYVSIKEILVYIAALVWFIPIVKSMLYYADVGRNWIFKEDKKRNVIVFATIIVLTLLVPAFINLIAFNPGISSIDTADSMLINAWNLEGMYDWHPFFYCLILRGLLEIWNSTYMVILVQYLFYAYVVTELMLYLRKKGVRDSFLIVVTAVIGFNAANYIQINTIWKDIPYTLSLLWTFIIVAKLSIDGDEYRKKWYIYLELVISLVGTDLYRKNGVVTFVIVFLCLIPLMKKNKKIIASLVACIVMIGIINGPLYNYFDVQSAGRRGMYIGLGADILGVYYSGGEVSEETLKMITDMTEYNNAEYDYNPTWSYQAYDVDVEPLSFINNYLSTFIKNPIIMSRAIIAREDVLWNIFEGCGCILQCVNYTDTMDSNMDYRWNEHYPKRINTGIYDIALSISTYTAESQCVSAVEWRCGLLTLFGAFAFLILLINGIRKHLLIISSPILGHILGLLLSTGWSEFRYFWPLNLLSVSFVLISLVMLKQSEQIEEKNLA